MTKYAAAGGLLAILAWGWTAAFSWLDVSALCRVRIDVELLEGDRASIKEAIAVVRREDPVAYRDLCRFIDRIQEEQQCMAGDPQADPRLRGAAVISLAQVDPVLARAHDATGCYMKGSRVIVLRRARENDEHAALLRERVEAIKRSAAYARAFWTGEAR